MLHPEALFIKGPVRLTRAQVRIVNHLLSQADEAVFLTAAQLGRRLGVSDATIVRLAQRLGFDGFASLRRHLRQQIKVRQDTVSRMEATAGRVTSLDDVLAAVMRADLNNLRQTSEATSPRTFRRVVQALQTSREVYIIGLRSAHSLAQFLASALKTLGRRVHLLTPGAGELWGEMTFLGRGSVVVAFSFPRYTRLTIEAVEAARRAGAVVISFTDSPTSPLAVLSDHVLPAAYRIDSYVESFVAALSLVNAVVTGLAFLDREPNLRRLAEMERLWEEKGVYYRDPVRPDESKEWPTWAAEGDGVGPRAEAAAPGAPAREQR